MPRSALVLASVVLLAPVPAYAGPTGADPASNAPAGAMPASCDTQPTAKSCVNAAVYYLNQSRASLGQGTYRLPADFVSLDPLQQTFVLTNLDRLLYSLPPIGGLTAALDNDSMGGVKADADPTVSDANIVESTSNWAGAFANMPAAYQAWMYDDGQGSGNIECTPSNSSGCWGHRHDILWGFSGSGALAMGAAQGPDNSGTQGYAMLLGQGNSSYHPTYTYTWSQAVADGAGTNNYDPGVPQIPVPIQVTITGSGAVVDPANHGCASNCQLQETQDVPVTLTARPASGYEFTGWGGACSGKATCTLTPEGQTTAITATFALAPPKICKTHVGKPKWSHHHLAFPVTACKTGTMHIKITRKGKVVTNASVGVTKGSGRLTLVFTLPKGTYKTTVKLGKLTSHGTFTIR